MSRIGSELRSVVGMAGVVSLCGIASLLVLYLGPQYGFGMAHQLILIALILLTLPFVLLINAWRNRRRRRREEAEAAASGAEPHAGAAKGKRKSGKQSDQPTRTYEDLTNGAAEAVQWLRGTKLGTETASAAATEAGDAVYALPWFLVAGPPASGKTSLVLSSGLNFQTLPSQRHAEHRLVRPTRSCEWRITDAAVLLDTAGRYQIEGANRDEWGALAETLKRHRSRRPLDGFLVVVSAAWALAASDAELEGQAQILRAQLEDVMQRTRMRFPVYLVWTHADAVEGFGQFFSRLPRERRGEVWGATIPLEQAANAHALFDVEFDLLFDALMRQRLTHLNVSDTATEQLSIFNFPPRVSETRNPLALFTSILFRPTPFRESPLLRGFYLTANVGNGQGAKVPAPAAAAGDAGEATTDGRARVSTRTIGEGFFIERFFKDVLLRDQNVAAALQPPERRSFHLRIALLTLAAILGLSLLTGLTISYFANRRLIADARDRAARVEERVRLTPNREQDAPESPLEARIDIEALERLRETVAMLDAYEREGAPLHLRFGLYAGNRINPQLRAIYFEALTQRYFKPTFLALEKDLQAFAANSPNTAAAPPSLPAPAANPSGDDASAAAPGAAAESPAPTEEENLGRHYDLLKAYLMITSEPERVEPTLISAQLADYWRAASPGDMEYVSRQHLDFYAQQSNRPGAPRAQADEKLVAQARNRLAAYPAVNRYYKRITTEINARTRQVTLASILAGRGGGVLNGSYAVPGSYTLEGFREQVTPAFKSATADMSKDDWVMGSIKTTGNASAADTEKLWSLYFRDYTDHWRRFLRDMSVNKFRSKDDAVNALNALTATDSPLELVMETVARQTNLSAASQSAGFFDWIKSWFRASGYNTGGNSEVEREFRPLIEFASAASNKDAVAISQYRVALQQVLDPLENSSPDQLSQTSSALMTGKDDINLQKSAQTIARQLESFRTAAGRDASELLKQPLGNVRAMLYGGGYEQIVREWSEQLYPVAQRLEAGYPFTNAGTSSISDLARYLNPVDGQLTVFFNNRLASSFDDVQGEWKQKETGAFKFSEEFVGYLNKARRLRDALFPNGGKQPEAGYDVTLQPVAGADVVLEIDGYRVETRGASPASAKFVFPARAGSTSGVRIVVTGSDGQRSEKTEPGEWGLFKLLQARGAGAPAAGADNSYTLSVGVGTSTVRATLRPSSAASPFERTLFTNLRAPQGVAQ
jgi:type VI secretion system protein ImpL